MSVTEVPEFFYLWDKRPGLFCDSPQTPTLQASLLLAVIHSAPFCLLEAKWSWLESDVVQNSKRSKGGIQF